MTEQRKKSAIPGIVGCIISALLVVSFLLPRVWYANPKVDAINNILVIVILCLSVHMVRKTSDMFVEHVWKKTTFLVMLSIPVINLLVTAIQLVWNNPAISRNVLFNVFLLFISLPVFLCYYFSVLQKYTKNKLFRIISLILDIAGILYFVIRLADKIILPLAMVAGYDLRSIVNVAESLSPWFSFVIYILSFVSFIICIKLFSGAKEKTKSL